MKRKPIQIFCISKRMWTSLALLLAVVAMFSAVNILPRAVGAGVADRQLPIYCVERDQKVCSLSFDAAWGNEDTQTLIDILDKYHIKATFFVVGQWVDKYPESVKALHDAGHEVMNHSDTHPHMSKLSRDEIIAEVTACSNKLEAVTSVRPTLLRPPFGEYDDKVISAIRSLGVEPIQWSVDSLDWQDLPAPAITDRVTSKIHPGAIVLFHNAAKHTPEALPAIIENLIGQGYSFLPISELILPGEYGVDYEIDHTGKQKVSS